MLAASTPALAAETDPSQWPASPGVDPDLATTAHTIRFSGPDRYQTNLAAVLALRGAASFPFDSPDRTDGAAGRLADADAWWGARTCPFSVLVVAGDTFADALTAASLSDPTNLSSEPRVQRVAAADPLFDPVGGFDRVDTDGAPIIATRSARQGASGLDPAARLAVSDLSRGGCSNARDAIIVGGESAVPRAVADELIAIGFREVFRLAGADRYGTAARVAEALGTGASPPEGTDCLDEVAASRRANMAFYANATVEFRRTGEECQLLTRSVVLADGGTGADALAAGWWTSFWQVPVLLTAPDGSLPVATQYALQTMQIDNVIVLGGTARIPESTVEEAGRLANAAVGRIAGVDRYDTSVQMARVFGGWYSAARGGEGSMVCLAASGGSGATARGWPDALAAGPWCGRASGAAANPGAPSRALPPVDGEHALVHSVGGHRPARDAVPILLVPPGSGLPPSVAGLLAQVFDRNEDWCSGDVPPTCVEPGFGIVFGGTAVVPHSTTVELARVVSGSRYASTGDVLPTIDRGFVTTLDLTPVYRTLSGSTGDRVCQQRGGLHDVRWLSWWASPARRAMLGAVDVAAAGVYRTDDRRSEPLCAGLDLDLDRTFMVGNSLSGNVTAGDVLGGERMQLSRPIRQDQPATTEEDGATTWAWEGSPSPPVELDQAGRQAAIDGAILRVELVAGSPSTFSAAVELSTPEGPVTGVVAGEALLIEGAWLLRGRFSGTDPGGQTVVGGFRADLEPGVSDPGVTWELDGAAPS